MAKTPNKSRRLRSEPVPDEFMPELRALARQVDRVVAPARELERLARAPESVRALAGSLTKLAIAPEPMGELARRLKQWKQEQQDKRAARAAAEAILAEHSRLTRAPTEREAREALVARVTLLLLDEKGGLARAGVRARAKTKDEKLAALAAEVRPFFFDDDGKPKNDWHLLTNDAITLALVTEERTPYNTPDSTLAHVKRIAKEYRQEIKSRLAP